MEIPVPDYMMLSMKRIFVACFHHRKMFGVAGARNEVDRFHRHVVSGRLRY